MAALPSVLLHKYFSLKKKRKELKSAAIERKQERAINNAEKVSIVGYSISPMIQLR